MTNKKPTSKGSNRSTTRGSGDATVKVAIITAIVTLVTTIITAIVGPIVTSSFQKTPVPTPSSISTNPTSLPTPSSTITPTTVLLTPSSIALSPSPTLTSNAQVIPWKTSNTSALNPAFHWYKGDVLEGSSNEYDLTQPGELKIKAIAGTDLWEYHYSSPLITYQIEGNFEVKVKVIFNPTQSVQAAGIGVRSTSDTFLRISRNSDITYGKSNISVGLNNNGKGVRLSSTSYSNHTVWLKIKRQGSQFVLSYSMDDMSWNVEETVIGGDYSFELPDRIEVFLFAFSARNNQNVEALFYDFTVVH